jgi:hypothetical protein
MNEPVPEMHRVTDGSIRLFALFNNDGTRLEVYTARCNCGTQLKAEGKSRQEAADALLDVVTGHLMSVE